ncbi:MAG: hypothetical protein ACQCN6_01705 [Candidatus Bathyarchaeia archaeon]|jgi:hypothetical protein
MTDLANHSKGIWRSIFVFDEWPQINVRNGVVPKLKEFGFVYSYCYYSETADEKAHIAFRVLFPDVLALQNFLDWLKSAINASFEDRNYDVEPCVAWAYVLGTRMAENFLDLQKEAKEKSDVLFGSSDNLLRLAFHGMQNISLKSYGDELELYRFLEQEMFRHVFGNLRGRS